MSNLFNVALAQFLSGCDPASIIAEARRGGADIVVFPEMYSNGYARFDPKDPVASESWRKGAQDANSGFIDQFRKAPKEHHIHVVATFLEAADPRPFNAALLIDPMGTAVRNQGDFRTSTRERSRRFGVLTVH